MEAQLRREADGDARPAVVTQETVDWVAEILNNHLRAWSGGEAVERTEDARFLAYCLWLFDHSDRPLASVRHSLRESRHVHLAAFYGRVDLLRKFAAQDPACLEHRRADGRRPLHCAAWNHPAAVRFLLGEKVDATGPDNAGGRPIEAAMASGSSEIFDLLVQRYSNEELDTLSGTSALHHSSALHHCASQGRASMLRYLVEQRGLSPSKPDSGGQFPVNWAANGGHVAVYQYLVGQSSVDVCDSDGWRPMHFAASSGSVDVVRAILRARSEWTIEELTTKDGSTPLSIAASNARGEVVGLLLSDVPCLDPNQKSNGGTPLHHAVLGCKGRRGLEHVEGSNGLRTVQALLAHPGTDPNLADIDEQSPLALATDIPSVRRALLRDPRIDPLHPVSKHGEAPLAMCIRTKDWAALDEICRRRPELGVTFVDQHGSSLLHLLIRNGAPLDRLRPLLAHRQNDVNLVNKKGLTPLMEAIKAASWDTVKLLRACKRVDVDVCKDGGPTALTLAVEYRAPLEVVKRLWTGSQESLFGKSERGWTVLHFAVARNDRREMEWFRARTRNKKGPWSVRDDLGRTPRDLAPPVATALGASGSRQATSRGWDSALEWTAVDGNAHARIVKDLGALSLRQPVSEQARIDWATLSFYRADKVRMLRIRDATWPVPTPQYFLEFESSSLRHLDGRSLHIHDANDVAGLRLTEQSVVDYVRFFCAFVHGDEGPFTVVDSSSHVGLPETLPDHVRKRVSECVRPAHCDGRDDSGKLLVSATTWYGGELFFSDFSVESSGAIEMEADFLLCKATDPPSHVPNGRRKAMANR
jgi:ankyrin repeat protein